MSEEEGFKVVVTGFKTQAEADAFIGWYAHQGEDYSSIWFECRKEEGEIECDTMRVDHAKLHKCKMVNSNQRELPLIMLY